MQFDRRQILGGISFLGLSAITSRPAFAAKIRPYPFTLGVASGDPWPDGFVLWTRLAPDPLAVGGGLPSAIFSVRWEISEDPKFRHILRSGDVSALPEWGHSVHAEITGLAPARRYFYRFLIDGHASAVGTAKTAPAALSSVSQLRLGVAGCQNYEHGYYTAYKYMAEENLDAIYHYGDYIYEGPQGRRNDIPIIREHLGPEPQTLDAYRQRYALYKSDPDLQAAHASAPFMMTFDDHEVENNWAGEFDENGSPPEQFLLRRYAAMQAWYENLPVRRAQLPTPRAMQMYRRLDYGSLVRVHLMDTRQYRDDQLCRPDTNKKCRDSRLWQQGLILGEAQHQWLADGLSPDHKWNLLAQQVVVMPHDQIDGEPPASEGDTDSWTGYPASRRRLVQSIQAKNLKNVVIATGDVHQNIVGYVPSKDDEPDKNPVAAEFVCTSISSLGDGRDRKVRGADYREIIARNPNLLYANGQRGYHIFNISEKEWRTDIMKVDKISHRDGLLSKIASFVVEPNSPLVANA